MYNRNIDDTPWLNGDLKVGYLTYQCKHMSVLIKRTTLNVPKRVGDSGRRKEVDWFRGLYDYLYTDVSMQLFVIKLINIINIAFNDKSV